MTRRTPRSVTAVVTAFALGILLALATVNGSATAAPEPKSDRVAVPGSQPPWAARSAQRGTVPDSSEVSIRAYLQLRHPQAAERRALAVSSPGNARYGKYLSSKGFRARYAPSAAAAHRVSEYLSANGFTVGAVPDGRRFVPAVGTAGDVTRAFQTQLATYRVAGQTARAVSSPVTLPRPVATKVVAVTGLNQPAVHVQPNVVRRPNFDRNRNATAVPPSECSDYWNQHQQTMPRAYGRTRFPTYPCGYTPDQVRSAYGLDKAADGSGAKVAILDAYASPTLARDVNQYSDNHGLPRMAPGQLTQKQFRPFINQDECGGAEGWNIEETLDVEAVHSAAPGAKILYVGAKDCITGLDDAMVYIVDNFDDPNTAAYGVSIVSNSYGYPGEEPGVITDPAQLRAEHLVAVQAASQGIGLYFSSGDEGDNTPLGYSPQPQPQYESSDPFVTGVGGTSLAVGSRGQYLFETGWGTAADAVTYDAQGRPTGYEEPLPGEFVFGGGGGVSLLFNQPGYQQGVVPSSLARSYDGTPNRVAPDVSMLGDPIIGFLVGQTDPATGQYFETAYGGTSLSVPLFAGVQAVVQGRSRPIGFANPGLYAMPTSAYHDVVPPRSTVAVATPSGATLLTFDRDTSLRTRVGYDDVTGRGSPNGLAFIRAERSIG